MRISLNSGPSISAFLNALLREYSNWTVHRRTPPRPDILSSGEKAADAGLLALPLTSLGMTVFIGLKYCSRAGRHSFSPPLLLGATRDTAHPIDLLSLAVLISHEEDIVGAVSPAVRNLFLSRLLDSMHSLSDSIEFRNNDLLRLFKEPLTFIESEQSLLLGHPVHPTPKSHDELTDEEVRALTPEFATSFPLRWMLVHRHRLDAEGTNDLPLRQALEDLIASDFEFPEHALTLIENAPQHLPMPMHPWQVKHLLSQPKIRAMLANGDLIDLGEVGSVFKPTSSVRSIYNANAPYMLKFSLSVRLTNSVRVLLPKEWERGKQIHRLFSTPLWQEISDRFPTFGILSEPIHMALRDDNGETIRESAVLFRQNPFRGDAVTNTEVLAGLCQDHPHGENSRLAELIHRLSQREEKSPENLALQWFNRFLEVAIGPFLQIHADYGLLFGAHQQNTVLVLENDYPSRVYYRDCQGTGHSSSAHDTLKQFLPEIGGNAQNTVDDDLGHRLFGYYLIVNNVFNVIASLAQTRLVEEATLFVLLREFLVGLRRNGLRDPSFVNKLIDEPVIWSKGNFLTCLRDINESHEGEDQLAVYVPMPNPIALTADTGVACTETSDMGLSETGFAKTG
ncbi:IucA/IucC family siderophore biosynthesis protein [Pelagibius sp. Alg239-R121]|uniref:IucA/IucC family protein n=1 Tax=Pelagibius sp. Alg239-R121 TaxID=2993448 RepID=UPI0024A6E09D|nr:IucA/IucC family protein [Pelagibius sp. Alg239-R121]